MNIYKKLNSILRRDNSDRINWFYFFVLIILVVLLSFLILQYKDFISALMTPILIVAFLILIGIVGFLAALAVVRSLFLVGASLSLIIFLAQSYCNVPTSARIADSQLHSVLGLGLFYILFIFARSLYQEAFGDKEDKKFKGHVVILREANNNKKSWFLLFLYALFVSLFLIELYQIISPIISNLCVYQK